MNDLDEKLENLMFEFFKELDSYVKNLNGAEYQQMRDKAYDDSKQKIKQAFAQRGWQYHLQQMVIADDPIKYLGENI